MYLVPGSGPERSACSNSPHNFGSVSQWLNYLYFLTFEVAKFLFLDLVMIHSANSANVCARKVQCYVIHSLDIQLILHCTSVTTFERGAQIHDTILRRGVWRGRCANEFPSLFQNFFSVKFINLRFLISSEIHYFEIFESEIH